MRGQMIFRMCDNEELAKFLHANYRAAFKALHQGGTEFVDGTGCKDEHDHGWSNCHNQRYFLKRATRILNEPLPAHMRSIDHGGHE